MKRVVALALLLIPLVALARPGGGESYSGGGGHGGSGGGGGGGGVFELVYYLVRLVIEVPQIGIPIAALVIGYMIYAGYRNAKNRDWDSGPPVELEKAVEASELRDVDPDFSQVVFEDFAYRLFATAQRARPDKLATVGPYVSEAARTALASRGKDPVVQVIVGAMRLVRVDVPETTEGTRVRIGVELEANIATPTHTYYTVESWLFARDAAQKSKPPGAAKTFPCPNCGAPWQAKDTGSQVCASCGQVVDNGRFDWVVEQISLASSQERPPTLTTEVEERGTDLPTYRQVGVDETWLSLQTDDAQLTWPNLQARLGMIYDQLNRAWSNNELPPVRGLVSDGLYDYLQYWVTAYRSQGLRNELVDMRITHATIARVVRDRWYDAVTIRVWGKGKDYVVDTSGSIVKGSKHRERAYSEYWTLIRSSGRRGAPKPDAVCGHCGAPLKISMAGACEFCGAHVTGGEFDWVLSKIEQDDSYRG